MTRLEDRVRVDLDSLTEKEISALRAELVGRKRADLRELQRVRVARAEIEKREARLERSVRVCREVLDQIRDYERSR